MLLKGEPKKKMPNKKNGIPDRWEDYQAVGKRIPGTRFISFKVPLKQSLCRRVDRSEVFGPWELMQILEKDGQELGLIIDLTFTTRYYNPEDLPDSVFYMKIFTAGHEVPSNPTILSFKRAVRRFLQDNTHNERENYLKDLQTGPKRSNYGMEKSEQEAVRGHSGSRHDNIPYGPAHHHDRHYERHYDHNHSVLLHQRGLNYQTHGHGLLPPPLPPFGMWSPHPNLFPPRPPHFNNYQWRPPQPQNNWRRPYSPEEDRRRDENWRSSHRHEGERRRNRYPPARPSPSPVLPHYSPEGWTNEPEGPTSSLPSEEMSVPQRRVRPQHRHTHTHRRDCT